MSPVFDSPVAFQVGIQRGKRMPGISPAGAVESEQSANLEVVRMRQLEIWFDHDPELGVAKVVFDDGQRGGGTLDRYSDDPPPSTKGFMAHMYLFVKWAQWFAENKRGRDKTPPWFRTDQWPASSVDELARKKGLQWRNRLLGQTWIEDLLPRKIRNKRTYRCLNERILEASKIHIYLGGNRVTNSKELEHLAEEILAKPSNKDLPSVVPADSATYDQAQAGSGAGTHREKRAALKKWEAEIAPMSKREQES